MGVIIGSMNNGSALCVESPDSPSIDIGQAGSQSIFSSAGSAPAGYHGYIASSRTVKVKRKFTLLKKDIALVTNWLASLSGDTISYNAGSHGEKNMAGTFRLDGEIVFSPISPSLCEAQATFIGTVLDCNVFLPADVEYAKIDDNTSIVKIKGVERTRYTSASAGDGSGISIRAGSCLIYSDIPLPFRSELPSYYGTPLDPDRMSDTRYYIAETQFREINLCINGEIARTWFIPCRMTTRIQYLIPQPICYGVTKEEYEADGFPVFTELLDLSSSTNDRLVGGPTGGCGTMTNLERPTGSIFQWYGYNEITSIGSYASGVRVHRLYWDENTYGKNPNRFLYLVDVGTAWAQMKNGIYIGQYATTEEATVTVGWSEYDNAIRLTAIGSGGNVNILMEYQLP